MAALTGLRVDRVAARFRAATDQHANSGVSTVELLVQGAHCANCIAKIEKGLLKFGDVQKARFNMSTGKLVVDGIRLRPAAIIARVEALGFKASAFLPSEAISADQEGERFLLQCLAIAAFGVAFVVPLTDSTQAIWFGVGDMGPATRAVINWVVALVACPATLLAARPFFHSALRGLSVRRANMDVPISLAIILSLALSLFQSARHGDQTYYDAAVMLTFLLLIGRFLDLRVRRRAGEAVRHLVAMQATTVRRLDTDGTVQTVVASDVKPNDELLLAAGERSPVDGIILQDAVIDASLVTGESAPFRVLQGSTLRAGSIIVGQPLTLRATAAVNDSLVAGIARLIEVGQQIRSGYVRLADRAAAAYVPTVLAIALAVFLVWAFYIGGSFEESVTNAVAVLIVTCPCALGLAAPIVQTVATNVLFRRGLIVKSGDSLERLAEVDVAVFDKTGTLTSDKLELCNRGQVSDFELQSAALLARASRHPLAQAIARADGPGTTAAGIVEYAGLGLEAHIDSETWRLGRPDWVGSNLADRSSTALLFCRGNNAPVRFEFETPVRPDARVTISGLQARGIESRILSGDTPETVAGVAAAVGISNWKAGVGPKEKVAELNSLRAAGRYVLMVGDGINDAAALSMAHVSLSPASASDAAQSTADIVFNGASLSPVVAALDVARQSRKRVLENFAVAILYNLIAVPLAAAGLVTPLIASIAMASSSLIVTLNALRISVPRSMA